MENGKPIAPEIIIPVPKNEKKSPELTCHRFFAPIVFPEPDKLDPRRANIMPRMGNFPCMKEKCTLWNAERAECWDVSAARGQWLAGEYAYGRMNDVSIPGGGE